MKLFRVFFLFLLLGIIGVLSGIIYYHNYLKNHVISGTFLEGEDISGLSREELSEKVNQKINDLNNEVVILTLNKQQRKFHWNELGIIYKEKDIVDRIFQEQQKNPIEQLKLYKERKEKPREFKIEPFFEEKVFNEMFNKSFPNIVRDPVNAKLVVKGKNVQIEGGRNGLIVHKNLLKERILEANLKNIKYIEVPLKEIEPEITREDVEKMGIKEVIASYKTYFNPDNEGKAHNIKLASQKINGMILKPGEIFDFNKVVGKRTKERGYRDATVFSNGQMIDDVGGGICQVSSTMYNAVVMADLRVLERHQHGLPVSYVPLGRDATLWYGVKNFRFKNTTNHHVYIQMNVGKNYLEVNIFGTKTSKEIYIESEVIEKIDPPIKEIKDPNLPVGQTKVEKGGSYGYKSVTYKITRQNGKIIRRERLSTDYYKPTEKVVIVGAKTLETTDTTTSSAVENETYNIEQ